MSHDDEKKKPTVAETTNKVLKLLNALDQDDRKRVLDALGALFG